MLQFPGIVQVQLDLHSFAVRFNRLRTDRELFGRLLCGETSTDQFEDFELTIREAFDRIGVGCLMMLDAVETARAISALT